MISYQPLDAGKNEIRLLYFKNKSSDTPHVHPGDIEFELRNVSLDAYTDKDRQRMGDTTSTRYDAWPKIPATTPSADDTSAFRAREEELDELATQPDFGRWIWGDYTTLSYTWGSLTETRPIIVNGCSMEVTTNLYSFLRSYTTSKHNSFERMGLWIDAVCINQGDIHERNLQVCRMGDIYSGAFGTIVWLGDASHTNNDTYVSDHTDKAMDLLSSFEPRSLATRAEWSSYSCRRSNRKEYGFPLGSWAAFYRVISQPYWTRLWIIQEIALGHDTPWRLRIVCGDRDVSWERFVTMMNTCAHDFENFASNLIKDYDEMYGCNDFGDVDDIDKWTGAFDRMQEFSWLAPLDHKPEKINLTRLMVLSRTSKQSDPRDKVYAVLGLVDARISSTIKPDYALSKAEVFKDFAQTAIRVTKCLDIITCQGLPDEERELPSWVPDTTEKVCAGTDMTRNIPYRASQDSTAIANFRGNDLVVQGIIVDQIDGRGTRHDHHRYVDERLIQSIHSTNPYGSEAGLRDAVWRTLFANRDSLGNMISESCARILDVPIISPDATRKMEYIPEDSNMFETGFSWQISDNAKLRIGGQELISFFKGYSAEEIPAVPEWKLAFDPFVRISMLDNGRLFITTAKGYFGRARRGVMRGDLVCILLGCSVPVILRRNPDENSYKLIGEAYIHGMMDGEVMDGVKEGGYNLEEICIR